MLNCYHRPKKIMQSKITREDILGFCDIESKIPQDIVDLTRMILQADDETEEFLLGLASGMTALMQSGELSESLKLIVASMLRECAISIRNRNS